MVQNYCFIRECIHTYRLYMPSHNITVIFIVIIKDRKELLLRYCDDDAVSGDWLTNTLEWVYQRESYCSCIINNIILKNLLYLHYNLFLGLWWQFRLLCQRLVFESGDYSLLLFHIFVCVWKRYSISFVHV